MTQGAVNLQAYTALKVMLEAVKKAGKWDSTALFCGAEQRRINGTRAERQRSSSPAPTFTPGSPNCSAHGADPNAEDQNGETALTVACRGYSPGIVALLLGAGARAEVQDRKHGNSPLLHAEGVLRINRTEVVERLLRAGARPETKNRCGVSVEASAASMGKLALLAALIEHVQEQSTQLRVLKGTRDASQ